MASLRPLCGEALPLLVCLLRNLPLQLLHFLCFRNFRRAGLGSSGHCRKALPAFLVIVREPSLRG
eukprot:513051-Heterocapsa_arctica.AAC.1